MTIEQIEIGGLRFEDYRQLLEAMKASYSGWQGGYWSPGAIERLFE